MAHTFSGTVCRVVTAAHGRRLTLLNRLDTLQAYSLLGHAVAAEAAGL